MANPKVHEVATAAGVDSRTALQVLAEMGETFKSPSSSIPPPVARRLNTEMERRGIRRPGYRRLPDEPGEEALRLIGQLPRRMPALAEILERTSVSTTSRPYGIPRGALLDRHFYFAQSVTSRSDLVSVAEKDVLSPQGMALVRVPNGLEVIAWTTPGDLVVFRAVLRRDRGAVLTEMERTVRPVEDGAFYINAGQGESVGVRRLAELVASVPTALTSSGSAAAGGRSPARTEEDDPEVRIVYLRRTYGEAAGDSRAAAERTSRWDVRGHWRNQWYPSISAHRRLWIAEHSAGPADGRKLTHDIVYVVRAPAA
jgi:hypothetical protein